jgi:hypothetical protein
MKKTKQEEALAALQEALATELAAAKRLSAMLNNPKADDADTLGARLAWLEAGRRTSKRFAEWHDSLNPLVAR